MSTKKDGERKVRRRHSASEPVLFESVFDHISKSNAQIQVRLFQQPFKDTETDFDQILETVLVQSERFVIEVKRRHAEMVFDAAVHANLSVQECRKYFARIVRLGFQTFDRETMFRIIFARYLIKAGEQASARRNLRRLQQQMDQRSLTKVEKREWEEWRKVVNDLLAQSQSKH